MQKTIICIFGMARSFVHIQLRDGRKKNRASLDIMGAQLRASLRPHVHHNTIVLRGLREPSLCQETQVFRTANMSFSSLVSIGDTKEKYRDYYRMQKLRLYKEKCKDYYLRKNLDFIKKNKETITYAKT